MVIQQPSHITLQIIQNVLYNSRRATWVQNTQKGVCWNPSFSDQDNKTKPKWTINEKKEYISIQHTPLKLALSRVQRGGVSMGMYFKTPLDSYYAAFCIT